MVRRTVLPGVRVEFDVEEWAAAEAEGGLFRVLIFTSTSRVHAWLSPDGSDLDLNPGAPYEADASADHFEPGTLVAIRVALVATLRAELRGMLPALSFDAWAGLSDGAMLAGRSFEAVAGVAFSSRALP